ncbi:radical SAM protein [Bacteroidota bacterium]
MARTLLEKCTLCPQKCRVNRLAGEKGKCQVASEVIISSYGPHLGEEAPLVGQHGSGAIFFTHCNLKCIYCQNYTISQLGAGSIISPKQLADIMLSLQIRGCHNINLVSPTHVVPQILEALVLAVRRGLNLPIVYNSGGCDSVETLKLLDGIVDIYMPDMKYSDAKIGEELSGVKDYPERNRAAVKEMHRQVGDLQLDMNGVSQQGLLVRHLVLPNRLAGTRETVRFLATDISTGTYLNVMSQYHPAYRAFNFPLLSQPLQEEELTEAVALAKQEGLSRLDGENYSPPPKLIRR